MTMRVSKIITYLRPEDAHTLVEFLDQLREILLQTYGDDIKTMLQETSQQKPVSSEGRNHQEPF